MLIILLIIVRRLLLITNIIDNTKTLIIMIIENMCFVTNNTYYRFVLLLMKITHIQIFVTNENTPPHSNWRRREVSRASKFCEYFRRKPESVPRTQVLSFAHSHLSSFWRPGWRLVIMLSHVIA